MQKETTPSNPSTTLMAQQMRAQQQLRALGGSAQGVTGVQPTPAQPLAQTLANTQPPKVILIL
jgi:hypothetical protein